MQLAGVTLYEDSIAYMADRTYAKALRVTSWRPTWALEIDVCFYGKPCIVVGFSEFEARRARSEEEMRNMVAAKIDSADIIDHWMDIDT